MKERTIKILTPHAAPHKTCVMGNEGIARAAIEAGVDGVFAYPGTPSTEISEIFNHVNSFQSQQANIEQYPELTRHNIYFEFSINEKIALEKAIAYSIGNRSSMCVMKNVGMNVACDPLMSVTYQTIIAPLVIVVCDDPGCHSSSNEQDSRYWGPMASVPVFNPATPADAFVMIKEAFVLSGKIKLPVIVRTTTRVSHTRGVVTYGAINAENHEAAFDRLPEHINIPARTATAHRRLLDKLKSENVLSYLALNSRIVMQSDAPELGIISSGVSTTYAIELLSGSACADHITLIDLGLIHPFPEQEVIAFLKRGFKKVLILEELDPIIENAVRVISQQNNIQVDIYGKGFSELVSTGEFSIDLLTKVFEDFTGSVLRKTERLPLTNTSQFLDKLPPRPPTLCAGCPHRATFYLLKLAIPREQSELIMCGDIGCFGLGALPPLRMIDTINHMGMSISMAQGLYESFNDSGKSKKVVALLGDGTFFHSGLTSLVNAVYTRANILVIIFDNRTIGMTGHQSHPGASRASKYHEIDLPNLLRGLGIEFVETINPYNIRESFDKVNSGLLFNGVSVIVSRAPCIFLPDLSDHKARNKKIAVDPSLCNSCANHEDIDLSCSRCYAPKNNLSRARARLIADVSVPGNEELCPANICNHGFFNSILEGDYKAAIEIVRDKMLFARTCGDVCHRPCELFANNTNVVPIKKLKHMVSSVDENFRDFSIPIKRALDSVKKNKSVAIVGAGPAGLSAAYDLVQNGYSVTVFEKEHKAGGMVTFAIPEFRMDKAGYDFEAMQLEQMGVQFHFNAALGKDLTLDQLSNDYDSVILAIGTNKAKTLNLIDRNIPANRRSDALAFLKSFNEGEKKLNDGDVVLVIGGGNSAIDAARSAKRLCPDNTVIVTCIEEEGSMPAFAEEVMHARAEGIEFNCSSFVGACMFSENRIVASINSFESKVLLKDIHCDHIITAIGQTAESGIAEQLSKDDSLRINTDNNYSGYKNVFAAGDICAGNNMSVIGAIASGKKAAIGVRKLLEGYKFDYEGDFALDRLNRNPMPSIKLRETIIDNNIRQEIEQYNLFQSCRKCNHCIDNFGCPAMVKVDGKVQIDMNRCTQCGLCIDVCPNKAIKWVYENELEPVTAI